MFEYVVTLKNKEDLDAFYDDLETPGGNLYIPDRAVDCANRRPISRNTHYMLTEAEAEQLRNDDRVLFVERLPEELGMTPRPSFYQFTTDWTKDQFNTNTDKNWGLLRCTNGEQIAGWGVDGTVSVAAGITVTAEGRNVDVVIVDGHINPDHPEFAVNSDGTGGTRVNHFDWFQYDVGDGNVGTGYTYTPYTQAQGSTVKAEEDNNHGMHVAGTVAGNTQGWARSANIYNISPYSTNPNGSLGLFLIDYIRLFHANKSTNPSTGKKNPTICNHSWGYGYNIPVADITSVNFRGSSISGPFTEAQLNGYGIYVYDNEGVPTAGMPARYGAFDVDVADAIADGIIMVGAASNDYTKIDLLGGADYNNTFTATGSGYYHRGSTPGGSDDVICVGNIEIYTDDRPRQSSNAGPRVDIHAPGTLIMSALHTGGTTDPRNATYRIGKYSGTSMASPQVCGVLACALEIYPDMTPAQALEYVVHYSGKDQITDSGGDVTDYTSLQGAPNRFLTYIQERKESGNVYPKKNHWIRPTTGSVYPRSIFRKK